MRFISFLVCILVPMSWASELVQDDLVVSPGDDGEIPRSLAKEERGGRGFKLPRFLTFEWYSHRYNKAYPSIVSKVVHNKSYLASLIKIFTQGVKFHHRKSSYYYEVNEMSDLTSEDVKAMIFGERPSKGIDKVVEELPESLRTIDIEANFKRESTNETPVKLQEYLRDNEIGSSVSDSPTLISVPSSLEDSGPRSRVYPGAAFISNVAESIGIMRTRYTPKEVFNRLPKDPKTENPEDGIYSDLRQTQCFTVPRNQGRCGSCYIYSAISAFEFLHCMETGKLIPFSEQYVMDCGARAAISSCGGGFSQQVLRFVRDYGLEEYAKYPDFGFKGTCPWPLVNKDRSMGRYQVNDAQFLKVKPEHVDRYLMKYPLVIGLNSPPDMHLYGGGVHDPGKLCNRRAGHAMVAVGHGRQDGLEYYLIRNSWGYTWGEEGYYKLAKNSVKHCIGSGEWIILSNHIDGTKFVRGLNPNYDESVLEKFSEKGGFSPVRKKGLEYRMRKGTRRMIDNVASHMRYIVPSSKIK